MHPSIYQSDVIGRLCLTLNRDVADEVSEGLICYNQSYANDRLRLEDIFFLTKVIHGKTDQSGFMSHLSYSLGSLRK